MLELLPDARTFRTLIVLGRGRTARRPADAGARVVADVRRRASLVIGTAENLDVAERRDRRGRDG